MYGCGLCGMLSLIYHYIFIGLQRVQQGRIQAFVNVKLSSVILIKMTNKMQLCRIIYYSIVPWLLYMFQAILSLIIRSVLTVITASGFIHCSKELLFSVLNYFSFLLSFFFVTLRPNAGHGLLILEVSRSHTTTHVNETRSCNYS